VIDGKLSPVTATGISEGADALLTIASPLPAGHYDLTFKLYQNYFGNPGHILGDFALAYATAASPTLSSAQTRVSIQSESSLNGMTFSLLSPGEWRQELERDGGSGRSPAARTSLRITLNWYHGGRYLFARNRVRPWSRCRTNCSPGTSIGPQTRQRIPIELLQPCCVLIHLSRGIACYW
jgi:hypothetical protein